MHRRYFIKAKVCLAGAFECPAGQHHGMGDQLLDGCRVVAQATDGRGRIFLPGAEDPQHLQDTFKPWGRALPSALGLHLLP